MDLNRCDFNREEKTDAAERTSGRCLNEYADHDHFLLFPKKREPMVPY
jgi:hypothetical protein